MIADEAAYEYMIENKADLFSEREKFDGIHGIMAYNRTLQRRGRTNQINPLSEWIVAVGRHPGIIPGAAWVAVQEKLELNSVKNYRGPRGNVALLSGLLLCSECGDYMRPKVTGRINAAGEAVYTYMCTMKERSHGKICHMKNINGNMLDQRILDEIKCMGSNNPEIAREMIQTRQVLHQAVDASSAQLEQVKQQKEKNDRKLRGLVDTLSQSAGTAAEPYIMKRINELSCESETLQNRLGELEFLTNQHELTDTEFQTLENMLSSIGSSIDYYPLAQKRMTVRAVIQRVVWDGENVKLYAAKNPDTAELPDVSC